MVENQNKEIETSGSTDVRRGVKQMDIIELRMRMNKVYEEQDKFLFLLGDLRDEGLIWYVGLKEKPTTFDQLRRKVINKWEEELVSQKAEEKKKVEEEKMNKRIEEEVGIRLKQEIKKKIQREEKYYKNCGRKRDSSGSFKNEIKCYGCGQEGHIVKGCMKMNFEKDFSKNSLISLKEDNFVNEDKSRKLKIQRLEEQCRELIREAVRNKAKPESVEKVEISKGEQATVRENKSCVADNKIKENVEFEK